MTDTPAAPDDGIPDVYYLENLDQVRVLAEPLRYRMSLLLERPRTCAGLARALGLSRPKAHYHLKQLEAVGIARLHSEALSNGIVEKFYVSVGRMLDFSRLIPRDNTLLPDNVTPETVSAISAFLGAMLQVSGEKVRALPDSADRLQGSRYFDFEGELPRAVYEDIRTRQRALDNEIVALTRDHAPGRGEDRVRFHVTNYLTLIGTSADRPTDGDET